MTGEELNILIGDGTPWEDLSLDNQERWKRLAKSLDEIPRPIPKS